MQSYPMRHVANLRLLGNFLADAPFPQNETKHG